MHAAPLSLATLALAASSALAAPTLDRERELSDVHHSGNHTRRPFTLPWFHPSRTASLADASASASSVSHHYWPFHSSAIASLASDAGPGIVTATSLASSAVPTHTGPVRHGQGDAYGHEHSRHGDGDNGYGTDHDRRDLRDEVSSAWAAAQSAFSEGWHARHSHSGTVGATFTGRPTAAADPISAFPTFTGSHAHHRNHTRTRSHSRTFTSEAEATETAVRGGRNGNASHKGKHRPFRHEYDDEQNEDENEDAEDINGDEASDDEDDSDN